MKQHVKRYIVLVVAQAACLALGLWLEQRFVLSSDESEHQPNQNISQSVVNDTTAPGLPETPSSALSSAEEHQIHALEIRAMAFVWITAFQAVVAYLVLTRAQEETSKRQKRAERVSLQHYSDLLRTRDAVIFGLARLAESRDPDTGNHLERVALYSTRLASALRRDPRYRRQLTSSFVKLIGISSALHDIGKVGIKDSILLKPGEFDEQERFMMQLHSGIGGKCVREIESRLGRSNFLQMAREIAFCHHERWDGTGYPKGLAGEEIPLAARIVAIADVYDALSIKRVYKPALRHRQCVEAIRDAAGTQFDPTIIDIFLEIESEFQDISRKHVDSRTASDTGSVSFGDTTDTPAVESSPDHTMSVVLALLEQYNDGPPADAPMSRCELDSVPALCDRSSNTTVNPAITDGLSDNDWEPTNVSQEV